MTGDRELVSGLDDPATQARPDVSARGRIINMIKNATPAQRKPLEETVVEAWGKVKKSGDLDELRGFVKVFGGMFSVGDDARLMLAERLMGTAQEEDVRDAENMLLVLKNADDVSLAARSTEALARLYTGKSLLEDAIALYADLNRKFPTEKIRNGKTGADFYNELVIDRRYLPFLEPLRTTLSFGKLKAKEDGAGTYAGNQQGFTVEPDGDLLPFFNRHRLVMDINFQGTGQWNLRVVDRVTGDERYKTGALPSNSSLYSLHQSYMPLKSVMTRGHLAAVWINDKVHVYDLADKRKLWEEQVWKNPNGASQLHQQAEEDGFWIYYSDGSSQRVGFVGAFEAGYLVVLTRDGLVAYEPTRKSVLWKKEGVSNRVQVVGTADHVFVFETNKDGGVSAVRCLRAIDGVDVPIPDSSVVFNSLKKAKIFGRTVACIDDAPGNKKVLRMYDLLTGLDVWSKPIAAADAWLAAADDTTPAVGYVSATGEIAVFDAKTGKELVKSAVNAKKAKGHLEKVESAKLLADRERFFVQINREITKPNPNFGMQPPTSAALALLPVNGPMYCFDRATGKHLWHTDEQLESQGIVTEQFRDLPIVFACYRDMVNFNWGTMTDRFVAIDKATGKVLWSKKLQSGGQTLYAMAADPKAGTIEYIHNQFRVKFAPDDGK